MENSTSAQYLHLACRGNRPEKARDAIIIILVDLGDIADVIAIIEKGRKKAFTAISTAMVEAYWLVGKRIVEEEQEGKERAEYGTGLLKTLSKELALKYGNGYSPANLRNFRQFYLTYPDYEKCYALRSKLSWTHHRAIMRVENERAREYYIKEAEEQNWNTQTLERNINSFY